MKIHFAGVSERPKEHDWKSCNVKAFAGSNPVPCATLNFMENYEEYDYFLHGTTLSGFEILSSVFTHGLKSEYGCSVHSTLFPVKDGDLEEQDKISNKFAEIPVK